jgi:hypothetical protein
MSPRISTVGFIPLSNNNDARLAADWQLFAQVSKDVSNTPAKPNNKHLENGLFKVSSGTIGFGLGLYSSFTGFTLLAAPEPVLTKFAGALLYVGGLAIEARGMFEINDGLNELGNAYNEAFPKK